MGESRHHNQAKNIVEYAWRHRNHNDDIPRQYLTDILVGSIAEALRIAYATSYELERDEEKARRVYYQDIVYNVCNTLDSIAGRPVGHGIVCGTKDEPHDNVQREMKSLRAALALLGAECNKWRERHRHSSLTWRYPQENEIAVATAVHATDSSPTAAAAVKGST